MSARAAHLRPPLNMFTCELMLQSPLTALALTTDPRALVRQLRRRATAPKLRSRLDQIDTSFGAASANVQVVPLVFTGPTLDQALARIDEEKTRLEQNYERCRSQNLLGRTVKRFAEFYLLLADVGFYRDLWQQTLVDHRPVGSSQCVALAFAPPALALVTSFAEFKLKQYDFKLATTLRTAHRAHTFAPDEIYAAAVDTTVPVEWHQALMRSPPGSVDHDARAETYQRARATLIDFLLAALADPANQADVRYVSLDHFLFRDDQTGAPTWAFFYRAYRDRSRGDVRRERPQVKLISAWPSLQR